MRLNIYRDGLLIIRLKYYICFQLKCKYKESKSAILGANKTNTNSVPVTKVPIARTVNNATLLVITVKLLHTAVD